MLERAKMFCIYTFTAATAALLGGFATENLPTRDADESLAAADETLVTTPDGWVVKEIEIRMPMVVPADAPIGLRFEDGEIPAPELVIPKHLPGPMPVPAWVPKEMVPHFPPQMNPWTVPQFDADPKQIENLDNARRAHPRTKGFHVYSSVQGKPGQTIGVGISADSTGDVRVYRYHDGGTAR